MFTAGMLALTLLCWGWMAVGAWPIGALWYRAELGDQLAVLEMYKRSLASMDHLAMAHWGTKLKDMSERDVLFMDVHSRKVMKLGFEAGGKDTPLLDILD